MTNKEFEDNFVWKFEDSIEHDLWFEIPSEEAQLLYSYIRNLQAELELRNTALVRESQAIDKLKRIEDVCDSVPGDWSIVGIEKIHEIEEIINEH